jgi:hypothetical protein
VKPVTRRSAPARVLRSTLSLAVLAAGGWGPIAHYEATKAALGEPVGALPPLYTESYAQEIAKLAQTPDYVTSYQLVPHWNDLIDVSPYFCWSHAVQDAGDVIVPGGPDIPLCPEYARDGRYPGPVMWVLLQKVGISVLGATDYTIMEKAVRGFRAHNAADYAVHFDFFPGPLSGDPDPQGTWYDHKWMEEWADIYIYIQLRFGGLEEFAFLRDGSLSTNTRYVNGEIIPDGEYSSGVPTWGSPTEPFGPVARIMRMGQLAHRKNRRSWEKSDAVGKLAVQSVAEIQDAYFNNVVINCTSIASTYTRDHWNWLAGRGYGPGSLTSEFEQAKWYVREWVAALQ